MGYVLHLQPMKRSRSLRGNRASGEEEVQIEDKKEKI